MVNQVSSSDFEQKINDFEGLTVVDFFATWCGPCKMLSPILEELSGEMDDIQFLKVDIDEEQSLASQFQIMSVPTLGLFKKGQEVDRIIGLQTKQQLRGKLDYFNN